MAINVAASPFELAITAKQPVYSSYPARTPNTAYDSWLSLSYASATDALISVTLTGTWMAVGAVAPILEIELELSGSFVESLPLSSSETLELEVTLSADLTTELVRSNWVKWSNIGSLDFTIGLDNIAGERPMTWQGWAQVIRKLGNSVLVYGDGGISIITPHDFKWGYEKLSGIGLHSRLAVCGNSKVHYFVDAKNRLCRIMEKLEILGYDEYIGALSDSLVLSYDEELGRVFICDGQYGYVYSERDKGLGRGPGNITGWSTDLIAAPASITSLPFEICTDIYDLGTRKAKTITSIDLGVDATLVIYAAIDWRKDKTAAFATTPWTRVNPNGSAVIPCWGHEFRFRVKQLTYEYFELDYIKVNGQLHNYSFLDSFLRGRQV